MSPRTHGLGAAYAPVADATAVRAAGRSLAAGTARDAPPATAAASPERSAAVVPPSAAAASVTPARSPVSVTPRASDTAVTGGHDMFAAAAAAAFVGAVGSARGPDIRHF